MRPSLTMCLLGIIIYYNDIITRYISTTQTRTASFARIPLMERYNYARVCRRGNLCTSSDTIPLPLGIPFSGSWLRQNQSGSATADDGSMRFVFDERGPFVSAGNRRTSTLPYNGFFSFDEADSNFIMLDCCNVKLFVYTCFLIFFLMQKENFRIWSMCTICI